jgi:DeoR family fructose operon transcriptional repressor
MLTEERFSIILEQLRDHGSVKLTDLCALMDTSESTVRRDLTALARKGLLTKVHGGAIAKYDSFTIKDFFALNEHNVDEKSRLFTEEKKKIAKYAASLIEDGDFVFLDAGTTTERMIEFLPDKRVTFVTPAFVHAKALALRGYKVFVPAGEIKLATEAIVGNECISSLSRYNFTKCFIGANGVSLSGGLTTPDKNEADIKAAAIEKSQRVFVLADHSKFDRINSITFASLDCGTIITDKLGDRKYAEKADIKEVLT